MKSENIWLLLPITSLSGLLLCWYKSNQWFNKMHSEQQTKSDKNLKHYAAWKVGANTFANMSIFLPVVFLIKYL